MSGPISLADTNSLPLVAVLALIAVLAAAAAGRVIGDARRERAAAESAAMRARLTQAGQTATPPAPVVQIGGPEASYVFHCVSCKRRVAVPLLTVADAMWRPIRCDDCAPEQRQGRAS